jgi:hypothetical protein
VRTDERVRVRRRRSPVEASSSPARVIAGDNPLWLVLVVLVGLAACAAPLAPGPPSPDAPRISSLEFSPERITLGCPVRISFHFEDPQGDVVRARARWRLEQSNTFVASGDLTLSVESGSVAGDTDGEKVSAPLTLDHHGTYWIYVQLEDAQGRKSNVLRDALLVDGTLPWRECGPCCRAASSD